MKTQYEEERYQFFTQPENFKTMLDVVEHSEEVVKRLIGEFWLELEKHLKEEVKGLEAEWLVGFSDAFDYRWNKLWIYQKTWCQNGKQPLVSIAFEDLQPTWDPYIGVHLLSQNKAYDCAAIKTELLSLKGAERYKTDTNAYWAFWQYLSVKLHEPKSLMRFLTENRAVLIKELVSEATNLMDLIGPHVEIIMKKHKIG